MLLDVFELLDLGKVAFVHFLVLFGWLVMAAFLTGRAIALQEQLGKLPDTILERGGVRYPYNLDVQMLGFLEGKGDEPLKDEVVQVFGFQ